MISSIKTSESNRVVVAELTKKLGVGPENIIARIAFAHSIAQSKKLKLSDIQDSKGKEYSTKVLFGDNESIYIAIISQVYNLYKTDNDIPRYVKMHLDDGLQRIDDLVKESPNLDLLDFVMDEIEVGLKHL